MRDVEYLNENTEKYCDAAVLGEEVELMQESKNR